MSSNNWYSLRDEVKSSHNCIDTLNSLGYRVLRPGQSIHAPSFIRPGSDSDSFTVYEHNCFDWVTHSSYDVIDLVALANFNGDKTAALESLAGHPLPKSSPQHSQLTSEQSQKFAQRIDFWHSQLLNNPTVAPNGEDILILDYLRLRGFSLDTVKLLKLGYSPNTKRLIIPFFNKYHQPCYFAGRTMFPVNPNSPKYSYMKLDDEAFSEIADKVIFGIDSIRPGIIECDTHFDQESGQLHKLDTHHIKFDYLAVCEGILDVLSFRAEGWAAISGKISAKQKFDFIDICKAYRDKGQKIFICFDSDAPGQSFQRKCADLLFRYGIPFVAGHLPDSLSVSREGRPDFGQSIHIKDVNDYYAAGGSLDTLVTSARDGMDEIAHNCRNEDELAGIFLDAGRCCDRWQIDKLKRFAKAIIEPTGRMTEKITKDGIKEVPEIAPRFNDKAVNFMYAEAMRPLQDCDIAHFVQEKHNLVYDTLGQFYEYRHGCWEAMNDLLIMQEIIQIMNGHVSASKFASVLKFLKADLASNIQFNIKHNIVFKNGTLWLDEPTTRVEMHPRKVVRKDENGYPMMYQGENGGPVYEEIQVPVTYHLTNPETGMPVNFKPHSPDDMSTIQLEYNYDPFARNEALERAAREWTANPDGSPNEEKYRLLKQMFGYILFVKNTLQKFFILKGDGANGKSTCMHCIESILGKKNTTSLQISRLSSEFDPITLKNSRVNLCYDAQSSIEAAQEVLKAVIGGDQITAAHKGVDAESFTTNAKFIVSANKFFSANDLSQGLLRRMLFIAFNNKFEPKAGEPSIEDEIMKDLPGLFNFAYEGYKDLMQSGYFVETEEQAALLEEFREQLSPVILFAREELYTMNGGEYSDKAIYDLYADWCKSNGEKALGRTKFIPEIRQVIRTDGVIQDPYRDKDTKKWVFVFPSRPDEEIVSSQPQDGQDTQERIFAQSHRQEVQEVSKSNEKTAQKSVEESASVHTAPVSGVQKEQQAQPKEETPDKSRQSSKPLPEQVDAPASAKPSEMFARGYKFPVPDPKADGFEYYEDIARNIFSHFKNFGRKWKQEYFIGLDAMPKGDVIFSLSQLAMFLKKKPSLRVFLPGVEDLIDFGEAH